MSSSTGRAIDPQTQNNLASHFASLHEPGNPVMLGNVYDGATAKIVCSHPQSKAVATASYAIAETHGLEDNDLTLAQNLQSVAIIASVVIPSGKPLTVDMQNGYDDVADSIKSVIRLGAVGCNIEDLIDEPNGNPKLRDLDDAVRRIKLAKEAAAEVGVPDFVINARTDVLPQGGRIENVIVRGKRFLEAGATTVFVWGGSKRGFSSEEVQKVVKELDGKVSVSMTLQDGFLRPQELKKLGVARVSVGPGLYLRAMNGFREGVERVFES